MANAFCFARQNYVGSPKSHRYLLAKLPSIGLIRRAGWLTINYIFVDFLNHRFSCVEHPDGCMPRSRYANNAGSIIFRAEITLPCYHQL
ncbi:uncharacterized protein LAJ45_05153 [Morchella importuna]|uniref:uncharacterized protein n=1 Tax=Morchella importuna TaxID=1174673 RepID=UPI001E8D8B41|nr:uncharacterized protein LAJ45_05153 [Morchella importuna]KAH8150970.1 hypothetical protein LAJ45_05153 [Morchella importuna]